MIRYLRALRPGDRWSPIALIVVYGLLAGSLLGHLVRAIFRASARPLL